MNEYMESNRRLWDEWTRIHVISDFYDIAAFRDPGSPKANRLRAYELDEIGDVTGKDLLHLQCHFGLDTLSLARVYDLREHLRGDFDILYTSRGVLGWLPDLGASFARMVFSTSPKCIPWWRFGTRSSLARVSLLGIRTGRASTL